MLIVGALETGPRRFGEIRDAIDGISEKMLTQTLRSLERDGLISRAVEPGPRIRVTYQLTAIGRTLREPLAAIRGWAERYVNHVEAAREAHDSAEDRLEGHAQQRGHQ